MANEVELEQIFSEYFGFPVNFDSPTAPHWSTGTIDQLVANYQVDSVSPHPTKLKKVDFMNPARKSLLRNVH
jgi:hypothetical protein